MSRPPRTPRKATRVALETVEPGLPPSVVRVSTAPPLRSHGAAVEESVNYSKKIIALANAIKGTKKADRSQKYDNNKFVDEEIDGYKFRVKFTESHLIINPQTPISSDRIFSKDIEFGIPLSGIGSIKTGVEGSETIETLKRGSNEQELLFLYKLLDSLDYQNNQYDLFSFILKRQENQISCEAENLGEGSVFSEDEKVFIDFLHSSINCFCEKLEEKIADDIRAKKIKANQAISYRATIARDGIELYKGDGITLTLYGNKDGNIDGIDQSLLGVENRFKISIHGTEINFKYNPDKHIFSVGSVENGDVRYKKCDTDKIIKKLDESSTREHRFIDVIQSIEEGLTFEDKEKKKKSQSYILGQVGFIISSLFYCYKRNCLPEAKRKTTRSSAATIEAPATPKRIGSESLSAALASPRSVGISPRSLLWESPRASTWPQSPRRSPSSAQDTNIRQVGNCVDYSDLPGAIQQSVKNSFSYTGPVGNEDIKLFHDFRIENGYQYVIGFSQQEQKTKNILKICIGPKKYFDNTDIPHVGVARSYSFNFNIKTGEVSFSRMSDDRAINFGFNNYASTELGLLFKAINEEGGIPDGIASLRNGFNSRKKALESGNLIEEFEGIIPGIEGSLKTREDTEEIPNDTVAELALNSSLSALFSTISSRLGTGSNVLSEQRSKTEKFLEELKKIEQKGKITEKDLELKLSKIKSEIEELRSKTLVESASEENIIKLLTTIEELTNEALGIIQHLIECKNENIEKLQKEIEEFRKIPEEYETSIKHEEYETSIKHTALIKIQQKKIKDHIIEEAEKEVVELNKSLRHVRLEKEELNKSLRHVRLEKEELKESLRRVKEEMKEEASDSQLHDTQSYDKRAKLLGKKIEGLLTSIFNEALSANNQIQNLDPVPAGESEELRIIKEGLAEQTKLLDEEITVLQTRLRQEKSEEQKKILQEEIEQKISALHEIQERFNLEIEVEGRKMILRTLNDEIKLLREREPNKEEVAALIDKMAAISQAEKDLEKLVLEIRKNSLLQMQRIIDKAHQKIAGLEEIISKSEKEQEIERCKTSIEEERNLIKKLTEQIKIIRAEEEMLLTRAETQEATQEDEERVEEIQVEEIATRKGLEYLQAFIEGLKEHLESLNEEITKLGSEVLGVGSDEAMQDLEDKKKTSDALLQKLIARERTMQDKHEGPSPVPRLELPVSSGSPEVQVSSGSPEVVKGDSARSSGSSAEGDSVGRLESSRSTNTVFDEGQPDVPELGPTTSEEVEGDDSDSVGSRSSRSGEGELMLPASASASPVSPEASVSPVSPEASVSPVPESVREGINGLGDNSEAGSSAEDAEGEDLGTGIEVDLGNLKEESRARELKVLTEMLRSADPSAASGDTTTSAKFNVADLNGRSDQPMTDESQKYWNEKVMGPLRELTQEVVTQENEIEMLRLKEEERLKEERLKEERLKEERLKEERLKGKEAEHTKEEKVSSDNSNKRGSLEKSLGRQNGPLFMAEKQNINLSEERTELEEFTPEQIKAYLSDGDGLEEKMVEMLDRITATAKSGRDVGFSIYRGIGAEYQIAHRKDLTFEELFSDECERFYIKTARGNRIIDNKSFKEKKLLITEIGNSEGDKKINRFITQKKINENFSKKGEVSFTLENGEKIYADNDQNKTSIFVTKDDGQTVLASTLLENAAELENLVKYFNSQIKTRAVSLGAENSTLTQGGNGEELSRFVRSRRNNGNEGGHLYATRTRTRTYGEKFPSARNADISSVSPGTRTGTPRDVFLKEEARAGVGDSRRNRAVAESYLGSRSALVDSMKIGGKAGGGGDGAPGVGDHSSRRNGSYPGSSPNRYSIRPSISGHGAPGVGDHSSRRNFYGGGAETSSYLGGSSDRDRSSVSRLGHGVPEDQSRDALLYPGSSSALVDSMERKPIGRKAEEGDVGEVGKTPSDTPSVDSSRRLSGSIVRNNVAL